MSGCCCEWDDIYITEKYIAPHCGTCECRRGEFEIRRSISRPRCSLPRRKISCYYLPDINYCRKSKSCLCYECRKVRGRSEASIHKRVGGKCSQHEKSVLETWFTQFDTDHDGYLDAIDLDDLFHHLGAEMRNSYSKKILNTCDRDCDGLLSFPEFVRLWQRAALHDKEFFRMTGCHILSPIIKKYKLFSEVPCCTCSNHHCKHVTFASEKMASSENYFQSDVIIMNDHPTNKKSQKKSVRSYASGVFQESTIGMVASIVTTHSRARRCFKSLLFALCISGFLYQGVTYLSHVFEYPTVVDIDIQRPEKFNKPAYTFCNNNGLKRSVFCDLYPDRCFEPSKKFCSRFYSYCGSNKTRVPMKEYYKVEDSMNFENILKYGDNLDDFLVFNKSQFERDQMTGPYIRTKEDESGAMICYSLNSVTDSRELPQQKERESFNFMSVAANKFTFYIDESEMFIPGNRPGLLFSIHSPYEAVNPFIKGIFMKPGRTYKIFVTMEEEILLKEPFQTKCVDYEELWEANNRTGPRIQMMCEHKCLLEFSLACFNCAAPSILYPNKDRKCLKNDFDNMTCGEETFLGVVACLKACKDDCRVIKYTPEYMERYEVDYTDEEDHEDFSRFITVEIYLEDGEVMTLRYSPKYMTVEIFSAIGGFIGVWLGISLMDITDVLASVFLVSRYAFRKHKANHPLKYQK